MRYQIKSSTHNVRHPQTAAALEAQLARQEAELDALTHQLKQEIANEPRDGRDSAECSADQSAFGVNASILEVTARTMHNIEDALRRLRTESYGVCLDCDTRIPLARLEALPFAERCRDCQEVHDVEERRARYEAETIQRIF